MGFAKGLLLASPLLVLAVVPIGCGERQVHSSVDLGDSGDGMKIDASGPSLCQQIGGVCEKTCPVMAPPYVYPPVRDSCKGKECCVVKCVEPDWLCTHSSNCKPGKVCTVNLGACDVNPCCPMCAACYGSCVPTPLRAQVLSVSAGANMMPGGSPTVSTSLKLRLTNQAAKDLTDVFVAKGSILLASSNTQIYKMLMAGTSPFSGKVPAQGSVELSMMSQFNPSSPGSQPAPPCNQQVKVRVEVNYFMGATLEVTSGAVKFGCVH